MHVCALEVCPCEQNDEGQSICTITGCCVRMLRFSDNEFLDTVCYADDNGKGAPSPLIPVSDPCQQPPTKRARQHSGQQPIPGPPSTAVTTLPPRSSAVQANSNWGSVNKKNRYRSWVHHRVQTNNSHITPQPTRAAGPECPLGSSMEPMHANSPPQHIHDDPSTTEAVNMQDEIEHVRSLIEAYVWDILCSCKWLDSMKMEASRVTVLIVCQMSATLHKISDTRRCRAGEEGRCQKEDACSQGVQDPQVRESTRRRHDMHPGRGQHGETKGSGPVQHLKCPLPSIDDSHHRSYVCTVLFLFLVWPSMYPCQPEHTYMHWTFGQFNH